MRGGTVYTGAIRSGSCRWMLYFAAVQQSVQRARNPPNRSVAKIVGPRGPSRYCNPERTFVASAIACQLAVIAGDFADSWLPTVKSIVVGVMALVVGAVGLGYGVLWSRMRRPRR